MFENFKKISLDDMITYIEENAPNDKAWFKSIAFDENGKYQHLVAVRKFCEKYMPGVIPTPKKKNAKDKLAKW